MTALLIASTGGHLAELVELAHRLPDEDRCWLTFDSPQSRSVLQNERVEFAPPSTSRDVIGTLRDALFASRLLRRESFHIAVSTGASVAAGVLPIARFHGVDCHYIESATRRRAPSLTGKILERVPGVRRYAQYDDWNRPGWSFAGSLWDNFEPSPRPQRPIRKIVVTLGTHRKYGFRRAVDAMQRLLPTGVEVLWQVGCTPVEDLDIDARSVVPSDEMHAAVADADVVVTHAGVGSSLMCFEAGKSPVLLAREVDYSEHVDDHQVTLARELSARGLAVAPSIEALSWNDLEQAAASGVRRTRTLPPLVLH